LTKAEVLSTEISWDSMLKKYYNKTELISINKIMTVLLHISIITMTVRWLQINTNNFLLKLLKRLNKDSIEE